MNSLLKQTLPFCSEEYENRLKAIKDKMSSKGIEVLLDSDPANIYYATGYDAVSYYTPQIMILSIYRSEPILVIREQDSLAAKIRTHLAYDSIIGWQDYMVDNEHSHPFELVSELIKDLNLHTYRIGIDIEAGMTTYHDIAFLKKKLRQPVTEVRRLINFVRMVKSEKKYIT